MKIGIVGLGKVGLPLAYVLRYHGRHQVIGYDIDQAGVSARIDAADDTRIHPEAAMRELLRQAPIPLAGSVEQLVAYSDVVIVIVPTPHPAESGIVPISRPPQDFDYKALNQAVGYVYGAAMVANRPVTIVVASTVAPGTMNGLAKTLPGAGLVNYVYNPVLISLGTVVHDLLTPDMILVGTDRDDDNGIADYETVQSIWTPVVNTRPILHLGYAEAELAKLALNGYVSMQINYANLVARLCEPLGADSDRVNQAISMSRQLVPGTHSRAGMSDGGACRPRDAWVLDWLARGVGVETSTFFNLSSERHHHTLWLAQEVAQAHLNHLRQDQRPLPVVLLGTAYKPGVPYEDGSPSVLLARMLHEYFDISCDQWDPLAHTHDAFGDPGKRLYVLATPHPEILEQLEQFVMPGSILVDIWGAVGFHVEGVQIVQPGRMWP